PSGGAIVIRVAREADMSVLSVSDNGEGIDRTLVDRVFDVFVQGNQDVGRSKGGIGLGLTLVKRLAELQGGFVSVVSEGVGRGATLTVRLPAAAMTPAVVVVPALQAASPHTILLVEDNEDAREMLRQVLAMQGHEVREAAHGLIGVDLA